jgi:acyl-ACP thioesterase
MENKNIMNKYYNLMLSDVDKYCRLRLSVLFRMFQDLSVTHASALDIGRDKIFDRGILWIVTKIKLEINRLPLYGEDISLSTWPGEAGKVLLPRYYQLQSSNGELLARASALWALINGDKRTPVIPKTEGIHLNGHISGDELSLPMGLCKPDRANCLTDYSQRTVLYSETDMNGHMNNSRYLDWTDDFLGDEFNRTHRLKELQINFINEATLGMCITLEKNVSYNEIFVKGSHSDKSIFMLHALYN